LMGQPLGVLPSHRGDRFPRSAQEPLTGLTPSSCRSPLEQSAGTLRASSQANNWNLVSVTSLRFRHVINGPLTFVSPATPRRVPPRLFRNAYHLGPWTKAACGGLDPDPAIRARGTCPHLLCSEAASSRLSLYMMASSLCRRGAQSSAYLVS